MKAPATKVFLVTRKALIEHRVGTRLNNGLPGGDFPQIDAEKIWHDLCLSYPDIHFSWSYCQKVVREFLRTKAQDKQRGMNGE